MPESDFDPYYKWLGIPPAEQPPNHYRLLGLQLFEGDPDVIANATDRQMAHVRTFQTGKHASLSQRLLNEFAAAKLCLLRPEKKAEYDRSLRAGQAAAHEGATAMPVAVPTPPPVAPPRAQAPQRVPSGSSPNLNRPRPVQPAVGHAAQPAPARPMQPVPVQQAPIETSPEIAPVETLLSLERAQSGVVNRRALAKPQSPLSNPLVVGGGVGVAVLLLIIIMAASRGGRSDPAVSAPGGTSHNPHTAKGDTQNQDSPKTDPVKPVTPVTPQVPQTAGGTTTPVKLTEPQMLRFDQGDYIEIKNSAGLVNLSQDFTAEMWVKIPGIAGSQSLLGTRVGAPAAVDSTGWEISAKRDAQQLVDFGFATTMPGRGLETPFLLKDVVFATTWHHLALCVDEGSIRLALDGQSLLTGLYSKDMFSLGNGNLCIGPSPSSGEKSTSGFLIRSFRLSSGVRYKGLFAPQMTLLSDPQTLALLDFSLGSGNTLPDLTGNGHDGQMSGATWAGIGPADLIVGPPASIAKPVVAVSEPATPATPADPGVPADPATPQAAKKIVAPVDPDLSKARALVRELYGNEINAAKSPEEKARLAQTLLSQAEKTTDDTTAQYAICLEALPLSIDGSNWPLVLQVIDFLDRIFTVDALGMKTHSLVSISKLARTPLAKSQVIMVGLEGLDMVIAAERNDLAPKLMTMLQSTAVEVRDSDVKKRVAARATDLRKLQQEWAALAAAAAAVKERPNDPVANLNYGKLLCLTKRKWDEGLPYLAKSGDALLVEAATQDLSKPATAEQKIKIGDLWWDLADKDKTSSKAEFERRAGYWYEQGVGGLVGFTKIKIEKRLEAVQTSLANQGLQDALITITVGPNVSMPLRLIRAGEVQSQATGQFIRVEAPFYMGVTEVTQAQWMTVMNYNLSRNQTDLAGPVDNVTFENVENFLDQLTKRNGGKYHFRLPTAAEWEYACRAGSSAAYFHGADESRQREFAWVFENSGNDTHRVGQLKPNGFGLHDMLGNVREMCAEKDQQTFSNHGGYFADTAQNATCSASEVMSRNTQSFGVGFRVVCDAAPAKPAGTAVGATSRPLAPAISSTP